MHDPQPVEILIERGHAFKKRGKNDKGNRLPGCEECKAGKLAAVHLGGPPSMNDGGSGMDRMAFQSLKQAWSARFAEALAGTELPTGLGRITVEAQIGFPTRARHDEGNHRWMIEKALGDALTAGGYLPDDSFYPVLHYSFGGMTGVHVPGRSFTRLVLFPQWDAGGSVAAQDTLDLAAAR